MATSKIQEVQTKVNNLLNIDENDNIHAVVTQSENDSNRYFVTMQVMLSDGTYAEIYSRACINGSIWGPDETEE